MELVFWLAFGLVFYIFLGYGILQFVLVAVSKLFSAKRVLPATQNLPSVAFVIAAYNEEDFLAEKIENTLQLDYPSSKLQVVVITDGSTDKSKEIAASYPNVQVYHEDERKGKLHAIHRVYPLLNTDVLIFSDANTAVNSEAVKEIVKHFDHSNVGVVSGEKRVMDSNGETAGKGEGIYWKYESTLKKLDSELGSTMGAAGELFAVRYSCMQDIPGDTIIEDFYLTMKIVSQGSKIVYEPNAYAMESGSANTAEEMKRKVRISAGGLQAIFRLKTLMNPLRFGWISMQFLSHRVMRWALSPLLLPLLVVSNLVIVLNGNSILYTILLLGQIAFYALAFHGHVLSKSNRSSKLSIIPYYFWLMNYCVYLGLIRLIKSEQTVLWEKAKRA
jgi:cellulose synthase/poly-beta-1,6-N-acetylglucosamine synthase-like glycosyltransferase